MFSDLISAEGRQGCSEVVRSKSGGLGVEGCAEFRASRSEHSCRLRRDNVKGAKLALLRRLRPFDVLVYLRLQRFKRVLLRC